MCYFFLVFTIIFVVVVKARLIMRITGVSPYAYNRPNVKFANKNNGTNFGKFLDNESKDAMYAKARQVMGNDKDEVEFYVGSLEQSKILEIKMGADGKVKGKFTIADDPYYKRYCPLRFYEQEGYLEDMESGIAPLRGLPMLLFTTERLYDESYMESRRKSRENDSDSVPTIQDRYAGYSSYAEMRAVEDAYGIRLTP